MGKMKFALLFNISILSFVPFCCGDQLLDMIKAVQEENESLSKTVKILIEKDEIKESRISLLEQQNIELATEVESLSLKLKESQKNISETREELFEFTTTEVESLSLKLEESKKNITETKKDLLELTTTLVKNKTDAFDEQLNDLEEFTNLVHVPVSCGALALSGLNKSKELFVDHDGPGANTPAIKVFFLNTNYFKIF